MVDYELFDPQAMNLLMQLNQLQFQVASYHANTKNKSVDVISFLRAVDTLRDQLIYAVEE